MEAEKVVQISPLIRRITAGNGSVFTGPGTNTYLVGNEDVTVIDPGPAMQDHIDAILLIADKGLPGKNYCIGGNNEKSNLDVAEKICNYLENKDIDGLKSILIGSFRLTFKILWEGEKLSQKEKILAAG